MPAAAFNDPSVGTVLVAIVIFLIARQELAALPAMLVALAFAFGTSAWSTASRSLWQHGPSMLLLGLALLAQLRRWPAAAKTRTGEYTSRPRAGLTRFPAIASQ